MWVSWLPWVRQVRRRGLMVLVGLLGGEVDDAVDWDYEVDVCITY
jgi:hypothetical protein